MDSTVAQPEFTWIVCDWRDEGEIHIVPSVGDEHGRADCWCSPEIHSIKGEPEIAIYVHNLKQ